MAKQKPCHVQILDWLNEKDAKGNFKYSGGAFEQLRSDWSKNDLKEFEKEITNMQADIAREQPNLTPAEIAEVSVKQKIEQAQEAAETAKKIKYQNILARHKIDDVLNTNDNNSTLIKKYLFNGLGYDIDLTTGKGAGTKRDIATEAQAFVATTYHAFLGDLKKQDGVKFLRNRKNSGDVAEQLRTQTFTNDKTGKIAKIIQKHQDNLLKNLRIHGFDVNELEGRIAGQVHDLGRILSPKGLRFKNALAATSTRLMEKDVSLQARDIWKKFVRPILDVTRSFPEIDGGSEEEIDQALDNVFDSILYENQKPKVEEGGYNYRRSSLTNTIGKKQRKIHFSSGQGFVDYQNEYGAGNLMNAILQDTTRSGFKVALMNKFGPEAEGTFKYMKEKLIKANPGSKKTKNDIEQMDLMFDFAMGRINGQGNGTIGTIFKNIMGLQNVSKLGTVVCRVLPDLSNQYGQMRYMGMSMPEAIQANINSLKQMWGSSKAEHSVLDLLNVVSRQMIGTTNSFGQDLSSLSGTMSRLNDIQFTVNLLKFWDQGIDHGTQVAVARHLSNYSDKIFEKLPKQTQKILSGYGFTPTEWEVWRKNPSTIEGHGSFITAQAWRDVSDKEISDLTGYKSKESIERERNKLELKATTFFSDQYKYIVPSVDYSTKSKMANLVSKSEWGVAVSSLLQFKTYSIGFAQRVIQRSIQGYGSKPQMIGAIAQTIAGTAALGYVGLVARSLIQGKGMPSMEGREGAANIAEAVLPAGGFWGDAMASFSSPYANFADSFLGPTVGLASDTYDFIHTMKDHATNGLFDKKKRFKKTSLEIAGQFAKRNTPFMNNWAFTGIYKNFINPPEDKRR